MRRTSQTRPRPGKPRTSPPARTKVFLVEDHPVVREGLRQLVERDDALTVCAEASSAEEGLAYLSKLTPDLLLVDLALTGSSGLEFIKQVAVLKPNLPMLVISMHDENLYAERAMRAGARGYIMKQEAPANILRAIHAIMAGQIYLSDAMRACLLERTVGKKTAADAWEQHMSDRELEVFMLLGQGYSGPEIADKLHLSIKTVESYRHNLKAKLGVKSGPELLRRAISWAKVQRGSLP